MAKMSVMVDLYTRSGERAPLVNRLGWYSYMSEEKMSALFAELRQMLQRYNDNGLTHDFVSQEDEDRARRRMMERHG